MLDTREMDAPMKNRAEIQKMYDLLSANGFYHLRFYPEGDGISIWRRQCGTPVGIEVRLFNNRFFSISCEDFERAIGTGITQLRSALVNCMMNDLGKAIRFKQEGEL